MDEMKRANVEVDSPLQTVTRELHNCIRDLDQNLKDLFTTLGPVLNTDFRDSAEEKCDDPSGNMHSDVHKFLENEIAFVNELASNVRDVTRRCEV